ncbi:MAG: Crp/Fnr family transcriptional regulator [Terriglobales bacterium]
MTNVQEVLRKVPTFADLSDGELDFLARRSAPRRYRTGEIIFSAGDDCAGLYVVAEGRVRIFKVSASGREQILAIDGPGSSVAELPVFDGGKYPASAAAVTDLVLFFISKEDFQALCRRHPEVALKVLRVVGRRLRALVGIIEELSFTTVRHRLVSLLLRQARAGESTPAGRKFTLSINNQEIAARIGTVRELVSRNLSRLQDDGLIHIDGRTVTVPDLKALEAELKAGE